MQNKNTGKVQNINVRILLKSVFSMIFRRLKIFFLKIVILLKDTFIVIHVPLKYGIAGGIVTSIELMSVMLCFSNTR